MLNAKLSTEGVKQLELAKALAPEHSQATYKLGLGYARVKLHEQALEMFLEACRINPNDRDYHLRLGVQLIRMGRLSDGLVSVKKALTIDPEHKESLEVLAKYSKGAMKGGDS